MSNLSTFTNSEQLYGVLSATVSGTGTNNVITGQGVLFSVTTFVASGVVAPPTSLSGASLILFNAVSGITNAVNSGNGILYSWYGGSASGLLTGGLPALPPDQWSPQPFQSGLNIQNNAAAALGVTVSYRKGI